MFKCKKCNKENVPHRKNRGECRECEAIYVREWKKQHPEKQKQYNKNPNHLKRLKEHHRVRDSACRKIKILCIKYLGGKCQYEPECAYPLREGYKYCPHSFHFHHKNRDEKKFNISYYMRRYVKESILKKIQTIEDLKKIIPKLIEELDKCELLCANCHMRKEHCDGCSRST